MILPPAILQLPAIVIWDPYKTIRIRAARISITIHENDPDQFYGTTNPYQCGRTNEETECGAAITMRRDLLSRPDAYW